MSQLCDNPGHVQFGFNLLHDDVTILGHISHVKAISVVFELVYCVVDVGSRLSGHISHVKAISVVFELVYCVVDVGGCLSDVFIHFLDGFFNEPKNSSIPKAQISDVCPQSLDLVLCAPQFYQCLRVKFLLVASGRKKGGRL